MNRLDPRHPTDTHDIYSNKTQQPYAVSRYFFMGFQRGKTLRIYFITLCRKLAVVFLQLLTNVKYNEPFN